MFADDTLQETNISPKNAILKMIFLFPRWDMLIPWRVFCDVGNVSYQMFFFVVTEERPF